MAPPGLRERLNVEIEAKRIGIQREDKSVEAMTMPVAMGPTDAIARVRRERG